MTQVDSQLRAELVRKGNQAFNEKDYQKAREYFFQADYKDGIVRLGDYYMYERRLPLLAYGYYRRAKAVGKMEEIHKRMVLALGSWLGRDAIKPESLSRIESGMPETRVNDQGMVDVPVSSYLRETALKILASRSS